MTERHVAQLHELRQSVWLDNLSRRLVRSGDLARLRDLGVTGITSNPTIFQRAIAGSADYHESDVELARRDLDELAALGISLEQVTAALENEGVDAFAGSYEELLGVPRLAAASSGGAGRDPR